MLYRKAYDKLLEWKKQKKRTALCIQGARQIGKTTVVREFGKMSTNASLSSTSYETRMSRKFLMETSMRTRLSRASQHWRESL